MIKIRHTVALAIALVLGPSWQAQERWRQACVDRCYMASAVDPELQRQEIVSLEREAARAIQSNAGAFFAASTAMSSPVRSLTANQSIGLSGSRRSNRLPRSINRSSPLTSKSASSKTPRSQLACGPRGESSITRSSAIRCAPFMCTQHAQRLACGFRPGDQLASRRAAAAVAVVASSVLIALTLHKADVYARDSLSKRMRAVD